MSTSAVVTVLVVVAAFAQGFGAVWFRRQRNAQAAERLRRMGYWVRVHQTRFGRLIQVDARRHEPTARIDEAPDAILLYWDDTYRLLDWHTLQTIEKWEQQ